MTKLINRLKEVMSDKNISQAELSRMTKINRSTISEWLSGKYEPKQDSIYIISKSLGINPAWLSGFDASKMAPNNDSEISSKYNKLTDTNKIKLNNYADELISHQFNVTSINAAKPIYNIEILGQVSAGPGAFLDGNDFTEVITTPIKPPKNYDFALQVKGNSMEPTFKSNQLIYVKKCEDDCVNNIVVAEYNGVGYVKQLERKNDRYVLHSFNNSYADIIVEPGTSFEIFGKVIE